MRSKEVTEIVINMRGDKCSRGLFVQRYRQRLLFDSMMPSNLNFDGGQVKDRLDMIKFWNQYFACLNSICFWVIYFAGFQTCDGFCFTMSRNPKNCKWKVDVMPSVLYMCMVPLNIKNRYNFLKFVLPLVHSSSLTYTQGAQGPSNFLKSLSFDLFKRIFEILKV